MQKMNNLLTMGFSSQKDYRELVSFAILQAFLMISVVISINVIFKNCMMKCVHI